MSQVRTDNYAIITHYFVSHCRIRLQLVEDLKTPAEVNSQLMHMYVAKSSL